MKEDKDQKDKGNIQESIKEKNMKMEKKEEMKLFPNKLKSKLKKERKGIPQEGIKEEDKILAVIMKEEKGDKEKIIQLLEAWMKILTLMNSYPLKNHNLEGELDKILMLPDMLKHWSLLEGSMKIQ